MPVVVDGGLLRVVAEFAERDPGTEQVDVVLDLPAGQLVHVTLVVVEGPAAADPGAGDVDHHPVRPDQVGVEGDQVAFLDDVARALLEPRVGAWPGGQQPALHPVAAPREHLGPQHRPQLLLGDAGPERLEHPPAGHPGGLQRTAHGEELVGALDGASMFHHGHGIDQFEALGLERLDGVDRHRVGGDPAAPGLPDQFGDLTGEQGGLLVAPLAGEEVGEAVGGSDLGDERVVGREEVAGRIVEQDEWTLGGDPEPACLVVGEPQLHVRRVRGVHEVHGVEQEGADEVACDEFLLDAADPVLLHGVQVGELEACGRPLRECRLARAEDHPVALGGGPLDERVLEGPADPGAGTGRCAHGAPPLVEWKLVRLCGPQPRMRDPLGSNSGWSRRVALRRTPRTSISNSAASVTPTGR